MKTTAVRCHYCDQPAELVTGAAIYPHRTDLFAKFFWWCRPCNAYVGCHPPADSRGRGGIGDGTVPLGRLANGELRRWKNKAHAAFDPIWKSGQMKRVQAYSWLAQALGISQDNCHIGMMDVDGCKAVVAAVEARHPAP